MQNGVRQPSCDADSRALQRAYDYRGARIQKIRPDGTKIRYFNRYAESRDGLLVK